MAGVEDEEGFKNFLRNLESIQNFTRTLFLLKQGAEADAETRLSPDECQSLLWAVQLLREKRSHEHDDVVEDEHYQSTACWHDKHDECRLMCKFCAAPCRCMCHV